MNFNIIVENGVCKHNFYEKVMSGLEDGHYLVTIKKLNEAKTSRDYQEQYFLLVDIVVADTGNDRYAIHEQFKQHQFEKKGIGTTKGLTVNEWIHWIEDFKWFIFENLNILL